MRVREKGGDIFVEAIDLPVSLGGSFGMSWNKCCALLIAPAPILGGCHDVSFL